MIQVNDMSLKLFGTDGIRGPVGGEVINPENALKLGWAIGMVFNKINPGGAILIGKDTRISGYMLESALQSGLTAAGMDIGLLGPMPTPAIAYLTATLRAAAGIVISASHNPFMDNGIKIFDANGLKISDDIAKQITQQFQAPLKVTTSPLIGRAKRHTSAPARYIERCKSRFTGNENGLSTLHIVLDCANGANYHVAPCVFRELGATVTILNNQPNGYNINERCGALHPQLLAQKVIAEQADCGIAFDGDGDRVIMVDHTGQICDGDHLLYLIAHHQHQHHQLSGGVVGTHMTNGAVAVALEKLNIPFERVAVGDRHVMARLIKLGWHLGGEPSGHLIDLNKAQSGDGIIAALQVLMVMIEEAASLHTLTATLPKHPQTLINLVRPHHFELEMHTDALKNLEQQAQKQLSDNGRILIRPSGTEALVRILVEDHDPIIVERVAKHLAQGIETLF